MDYEKLYKDALEKARAFYETKSPDCLILESIFPELAESEDERIRKEIIQFLQLPHPQFIGKRNHKKWIAWLEKQGEEKVYSVWVGGSEINDYYLTEKEAKKLAREYKENGYDDVIIEKQGEQKSAWSEEDEYQINTILHELDLKREIYKKEGNKVEEDRYNMQYNWLKSLKDRIN